MVIQTPLLYIVTVLMTSYSVTQCRPDPPVIRIGMVAPFDGLYGWSQTASAATLAIKHAQSEGYLNNSNIMSVIKKFTQERDQSSV